MKNSSTYSRLTIQIYDHQKPPALTNLYPMLTKVNNPGLLLREWCISLIVLIYCSGMKKENTIKRASVIMSLGMVLLIALLVIWLTGTYHQTQKELQESLENISSLATAEVQDSVQVRMIRNLKQGISILVDSDSSVSFENRQILSEGNQFISDLPNVGDIKEIETTRVDKEGLFVHIMADSMSASIEHSDSIIDLTPSGNGFPSYLDSIREKDDNVKSGMAFLSVFLENYSQIDSLNQMTIRQGFPLNHEEEYDIIKGAILKHQPDGIQLAFSQTAPSNTIIFPAVQHKMRSTGAMYYMGLSSPWNYFLKKIGIPLIIALITLSLISWAFISIYRGFKRQQKFAEAKDDFINNMTHELQTPITTIGIALEALTHFGADKDPVLKAKYMSTANAELKRLSLLVDKSLGVAKMQGGEWKLQTEKLELNETLQKVCNSMKLQFEKHNGTLQLLSTEDDIDIIGDPAHLSNVFYNLLDNSIKYNDKAPEVKIHISRKGNKIQTVVIDNGQGMDREHLKKIFDKFYRVPLGDIHNVKGNGLGLSYVKEVVEKHGGKIFCESEKGIGTSFHIELPNIEKQAD